MANPYEIAKKVVAGFDPDTRAEFKKQFDALKTDDKREAVIQKIVTQYGSQYQEADKRTATAGAGMAGLGANLIPQQTQQDINTAVMDVPSAAIRSQLQGTGYAKGAMNPEQVPTFQQQALDKFYGSNILKNNPNIKGAVGMIPSAAGLGADIATNPAMVLAMLAGKTPTGGGTTLGSRIGASALGKAVNEPINLGSMKNLKSITPKMSGSPTKQLAEVTKNIDLMRAKALEGKAPTLREITSSSKSGGDQLKEFFFNHSKAMNKEFSPKYDAILSEQNLPKQSILEGLNNAAKRLELVGDRIDPKTGATIPPRSPSGKAETELMKYLGELSAEAPDSPILQQTGTPFKAKSPDVVKGRDVLSRFKSLIKEKAGKQYNQDDHALTVLKEELLKPITENVKGLKELNAAYSKKASMRDFLYKKSKPFDESAPHGENFMKKLSKGTLSETELEYFQNALSEGGQYAPQGLKNTVSKLSKIAKERSAMAEDLAIMRAKQLRLKSPAEAEKAMKAFRAKWAKRALIGGATLLDAKYAKHLIP